MGCERLLVLKKSKAKVLLLEYITIETVSKQVLYCSILCTCMWFLNIFFSIKLLDIMFFFSHLCDLSLMMCGKRKVSFDVYGQVMFTSGDCLCCI